MRKPWHSLLIVLVRFTWCHVLYAANWQHCKAIQSCGVAGGSVILNLRGSQKVSPRIWQPTNPILSAAQFNKYLVQDFNLISHLSVSGSKVWSIRGQMKWAVKCEPKVSEVTALHEALTSKASFVSLIFGQRHSHKVESPKHLVLQETTSKRLLIQTIHISRQCYRNTGSKHTTAGYLFTTLDQLKQSLTLNKHARTSTGLLLQPTRCFWLLQSCLIWLPTLATCPDP